MDNLLGLGPPTGRRYFLSRSRGGRRRLYCQPSRRKGRSLSHQPSESCSRGGKLTLLARTQSICLRVAIVTAVAQTLAAFALKESYGATVIGDIASLILTGVLLILCGLNSRSSTGPARTFWLLNIAAFTFLLSFYSYWSYSEVLLKKSAPNPLIGDGF